MTQPEIHDDTRILSTLRADGSRRWLRPRVSQGRFWQARRTLAYVLIAIFTLLPYVTINGRPAILLDLPHREFTFFGLTLLPTDTLLPALLLLTAIVGIALTTAMLGRVWCGWACPQTVYLEFVYRPIERLFDGPPGSQHRAGKRGTSLRTVLKFLVYLAISAFLAHTFLAYFVGVATLAQWMQRSPIQHPFAFMLMLGVTALMLFDFGYFREYTCIVACPYGRLQSVMLDRDSLIVSYDTRRGEPRGKLAKGPRDKALGDCIECGACTDTCPTGIDIRNGLQLECVACTQCIDACDSVMDRIGKPRGLIRISSQARIAGEKGRLIRPRVIIYPIIMAVLFTALVVVVSGKRTADASLTRGPGSPFYEVAPGEIINVLSLKLRNRQREAATYHVEMASPPTARLRAGLEKIDIEADGVATQSVVITLPASAFTQGHCDVVVRISDQKEYHQEIPFRLLGP